MYRMTTVTVTVLEKDKNELQQQLSKTDKERTLATHREADLAKKVRLLGRPTLVGKALSFTYELSFLSFLSIHRAQQPRS